MNLAKRPAFSRIISFYCKFACAPSNEHHGIFVNYDFTSELSWQKAFKTQGVSILSSHVRFRLWLINSVQLNYALIHRHLACPAYPKQDILYWGWLQIMAMWMVIGMRVLSYENCCVVSNFSTLEARRSHGDLNHAYKTQKVK